MELSVTLWNRAHSQMYADREALVDGDFWPDVCRDGAKMVAAIS